MAKWVFWADEIAEKIINRKKFHLIEKQIPKIKNWTVKSGSSLSGVLHIGRLSDIIRNEAAVRALQEQGFKAKFIHVMDDMDPLRKIPKGVPANYEQYIGFPVSDIPDPAGCHKSYAAHFTEEFMNVFKNFFVLEPEVQSTREEYKKGNFTESAIELVKNSEKVKEIIERVQGSKVSENWSPWKPICDKCGNLQTTAITKIEGTKIYYKCQDYAFEKFTAKGCGNEGTADLKKANGKLVWKSEWAAQWKRWQVCAEGAGKEYESSNSAFWVNAEIAERILDFPCPEPFFYEHIMVGGVKMSASLGNVIYPRDWLKVSKPETLKYLYMKRLMKTRSFEWKDIPVLELELDRTIKDAQSKNPADEIEHFKNKKYENFAKVKGRTIVPLKADYALCAFLSGIYPEETVLEKLKEMGQVETGKKEEIAALKERITLASEWQKKYAPEESKIAFSEKTPEKQTTENMKQIFAETAKILQKTSNAEEIQQAIYELGKQKNIPAQELFKEFYQTIIAKDRGPKLGQLIIALGKEKITKKLEQLSKK